MRTIKFRAKCEDKGAWRYGYLLHDTNGRPVISNFDNDLFVNTYGCIKGTEGQFTGLLDKNGREIYEGDVVRVLIPTPDSTHHTHLMYTGVIKYHAGGFSWFSIEHKSLYGELINNVEQHNEVIGNIHENPELLKL